MSEFAGPALAPSRPDPATPPDKAAVVQTLRRHAPALRRLGVAKLWLYGSVARGDATEASDVDLLVDLAPSDRPFSLIDLSTLRLALEDLLGRETQVAVRADLRPGFLARIGDDLVGVF